MTTAGVLSAQYIFHAITIGPPTENLAQKEIVRQTTRRCLQLLKTLNLTSIAFPAIGSGAARFRYEDVATEMAQTICDEAIQFDREIDITIYLFDRYGSMTEIDFLRFFEECAARVPRLSQSPVASLPQPDVKPSVAHAVNNDEADWQEIKSRRLHWLSKLISSLEGIRMKIEENLVLALAEGDDAQSFTAREKLKQNEDLRSLFTVSGAPTRAGMIAPFMPNGRDLVQTLSCGWMESGSVTEERNQSPIPGLSVQG